MVNGYVGTPAMPPTSQDTENYGDKPSREEEEYVESRLHKFDSLDSARQNFSNNWQECYENIVPRKNDVISSRLPGDKRGSELFDTTAVFSNLLFAGALHGMLTNPTTRFFDIFMSDPELNDDPEVQDWLQEESEEIFQTMNYSNFQTEVHEIYIDLGAIGTSCMFVGEHDERVVHFSARAMKEVYVDENNLGMIDTVYRKFCWKPRQIVQQFGLETLPKYVQEQYNKGCNDDWEIIHLVEPKDASNNYGNTYFPIHSCYILKDKKLKLSSGGFKEFPYAVPRWTKTSGEVYGRGPGMDMLPDIKMVNVMMETTIKGAQKTVDPPVTVEDDSVVGKVRLTPGGITLKRPGSDPIVPIITNARIDFGYQAIEDVRNRIRAGFYVDQLQLREGPQMTATETNARIEERFRLMGPVMGRQHFEFLRPIVERVFAIRMRKGLVKPMPRQMHGKKWDVRYSSFIARVQRMNDMNNVARAFQMISPFLQIDPNARDNIKADKGVKYVWDGFGLPVEILTNDGEKKKIRDARQQAQQQAAQEMQQQHQADMVQKTVPAVAQMQQAQQAGQ